jgi:hypothetical protein
MKLSTKPLLFWTPKILGIIYAIFVSLFALDVFGMGYGFWETFSALLIHLIPTAIILVVLFIAWRWDWVGGILFIILGGLYLTIAWGSFPWSVYVIMSGPLFLIGILFLLNWLGGKEIYSRKLEEGLK